jgi:phospholipase C
MTGPGFNARLSRRQLLASLGFASEAAVVGGPAEAFAKGSKGIKLVRTAAATTAAGSDLGAVDHIVFLMMENRSYDRYFGAYPKGRGFDDHPNKSLGVFAQVARMNPGYGGSSISNSSKVGRCRGLPLAVDRPFQG